eukprot:RCo021250
MACTSAATSPAAGARGSPSPLQLITSLRPTSPAARALPPGSDKALPSPLRATPPPSRGSSSNLPCPPPVVPPHCPHCTIPATALPGHSSAPSPKHLKHSRPPPVQVAYSGPPGPPGRPLDRKTA